MIRLNNYAEPIDDRGGTQYYKWEVFVDASGTDLDLIDWVEYRLHPTFSDPRQRRADRATKFALRTSGWGEFLIVARVAFRDGHTETTRYQLDLSKRYPASDN